MKPIARHVCVVLITACTFITVAHGAGQADEPNDTDQASAHLAQSAMLDMVLDQSGVLEGVGREDAEAFRARLMLALARLFESDRNNVFEDADERLRGLGVALAKACLTGRVQADDVGEAMAVIAVGTSLPRHIVAEALIQAIGEADDPASISTPYNDLMRYVYDQSGPGQPMDIEPIASRLRKADDRQREKIIVHLLAYDAEQAFRPILAAQGKTIEDLTALSWFDRRLQESRWAAKHSFKLDPGFKQQLRADYLALLGHEQWWVRLYAVELLGDLPWLASQDVLRGLTDDENRYVRARVTALLAARD